MLTDSMALSKHAQKLLGAYVMLHLIEQHKPTTFAGLVNAFREYQDQKQEA